MIIGKSAASLMYAWRTQQKCILLDDFVFHHLSDEFDNIDFSEFNVQSARELIPNLIFAMSLTSLLLHGGNVSSFRIDNKELITKGNTKITIGEDLEIFDGEPTGINQVFDDFYWRAGKPHDTMIIESEEDFCKRIFFYETRRSNVSKIVKDFTVISRMSDDELLDPSYGNGIVRIKTQRMFKKNDIKGEFSWQRGDKRYYKKVKFDFEKRFVLPELNQKMTFEQAWNLEQKKEKPWTMWKKLMSKEKTWLD